MSSPKGLYRSIATNARHLSGVGLLLFDLDDTIVQYGSIVSPRVMASLVAAREAGFLLGIATGRPLCIVTKSVLESGVMDFALCSNGATVARLSDGVELVANHLSQEDALDCYEMLESYHPAWNAFFDGRAYFEWRGASYMLTGRTGAIARAMRREDQGSGILRLVKIGKRGIRFFLRMVPKGGNRQVVSIRRHLLNARGDIEKMGCTIVDRAACVEVEQLLRADGRFEVVSMSEQELEITARGVTKGTGATALLRAVGIERGRSVAFGDGGNDLPLASAVGRFVAMGNADEDVKEAAFEVCPPVSEDGVAVWIENMLAAGGLEEGVRYV